VLGAKGAYGLWHPVIEPGFETRFDLANSLSYDFVMVAAILLFYRYANKRRLSQT
jgi:hypothetical protein